MKISIWFMHDNHTFSKLKPGSIAGVIQQAKNLLKKSPHGNLCPVKLLSNCGNEIRTVGKMVHSNGHELDDTSKWEAAIRSDADALRLIETDKENVKIKFISSHDYENDEKVIEGHTIDRIQLFNENNDIAIIFTDDTYFVLQCWRPHYDLHDVITMRSDEPELHHQREIGVITEEEFQEQLKEMTQKKRFEQHKKDYAAYLKLKEKFEGGD